MIPLAAVVAVACGVVVLDRRRRSRLAAEVWPWMIDEIEARVRGGQPLPTAALGVALHGPPPLPAAAGDARRVLSFSGDARAALRELQRVAADPRFDRLRATVDTTHDIGGDVGGALARLRVSAVEDARRERELARGLTAIRSAAWLSLAPVVVMAVGGFGAMPAVLTAAAAAAAWFVVALAPGTAAPRINRHAR